MCHVEMRWHNIEFLHYGEERRVVGIAAVLVVVRVGVERGTPKALWGRPRITYVTVNIHQRSLEP